MKSVFTCGSVSDGATTNFVNPSYPEWDTNAGNSRTKNHICTFLLKIPDDAEDICQVNMFCLHVIVWSRVLLWFDIIEL